MRLTPINPFSAMLTRPIAGTAKTTALALLAGSWLIALGGCSWFQFPGVYKLTIQQGNIVTQEMVDQLQPGMSKRQVNYVLGTPLIQDSFNQNRWDYYYSKKNPDGKTVEQQLTVYFEEGKLTHFTGDLQPSSAISAPVADTPVEVPDTDELPESSDTETPPTTPEIPDNPNTPDSPSPVPDA